MKPFFILCVFLCLLSLVGFAEQVPSLFGIIYDSHTGQTLDHAEVFLVGCEEIVWIYATPQGEYIIWKIPQGTYKIIVVADGYYSQVVDLRDFAIEQKEISDISLSFQLAPKN